MNKKFETFADLCAATGKNEQDCNIIPDATAKVNEAICRDRLNIMADAYNDGKKPDLINTRQDKYTPVHQIIPDTNSPFGFRLSYSVFDSARGYSHLGARPAFLKLDDAICAGKQHVGEFEQWLYYLNKMYQE